MDNDNVGLFDMDGTTADYDEAMWRDLNALQSDEETPMTFERMHDLPEPWESRRKLIVQKPGWWLKLKKMEVGIWLFETAVEIGFEPHVLTKGPKHCPNAWKEKVEWCWENLLPLRCGGKGPLTERDLDIHIVSDKGLMYGKFLADDYPPYIEKWLAHRKNGLVLMPVNEFNKNFTHPNVIPCGGNQPPDHYWKDRAISAMQVAYKRNPREPLVLPK